MTQLMTLAPPDTLRFSLTTDDVLLDGTLLLPAEAQGVVIFAQSSGTSRLSPSNRIIARQLSEVGFAALLIDLLTIDEDAHRPPPQRLCADIALLSRRLLAATDQIRAWPETSGLSVGYFGIGTGTVAAFQASTERPGRIGAIVSCCGTPELASAQLVAVRAPTLLIVGGGDHAGITRNEAALPFLPEESSLALIPGAGARLEGPAALEQAAGLAARWYGRFLR